MLIIPIYSQILEFSVNKKIGKDLWLHICERCKKEWASKNENPVHCAKCNSPYWNKKKTKMR